MIGQAGPVELQLDRDSVAAGDDVVAHEERREVDGRRPLEQLVAELVVDHFLPRIQGGRSCWILRVSRGGDPIGVVRIRDGRFEGLRLLAGEDPTLSQVGRSLFFEYAAQDDADEAFDRLSDVP